MNITLHIDKDIDYSSKFLFCKTLQLVFIPLRVVAEYIFTSFKHSLHIIDFKKWLIIKT